MYALVASFSYLVSSLTLLSHSDDFPACSTPADHFALATNSIILGKQDQGKDQDMIGRCVFSINTNFQPELCSSTY